MTYTEVFGGTTLYPSQVTYFALTLSSANVTLDWPMENVDTAYPAARVIDVTSSNTRTITLPDATLTGPGQTILFNNLSASSTSFYVVDAAGGAVATVTVGTAWQVYLAGTATAAGTWRKFQLGASTATVQASDLDGAGLTVISSQLAQSTPVTDVPTSPYTVLTTDRASLLVWSGSGAGTINMLSAATAGANYFVSVRNSGDGALTIDADGSDLIDGAATLVLQPSDSVTLSTDGADWFSLGLGQEPVFAFDYTVIDLTGETSPYTLSGSELNRIAYSFIGTLTGNMRVNVPATYQQYWVANNTTGAYTLSLSTSGGASPVLVNQGSRDILYCNGSEVVDADTAALSVPITASQGGTGQTSYAVGDLLYASGTTSLSKLADVATGNALISGGVATVPSWGKIGLTTHVSGTLPVANGGTGITALGTGVATALGVNVGSAGAFVTFNGALGTPSSGTLTNCSGLPLAGLTSLGTGVATALAINVGSAGAFVTFNGALGTPSSGTLTSCTGLPLTTGITGTLAAANGGTGQGGGYTIGDILYASGASALSKLADVATGNALISGGVGTAPSWGKIGLTTHISGTLGVGNGGTGTASTPTNGQLLIGNGTNFTLATITQGAGIALTNGAGTITVATSIPQSEANSSVVIGTSAGGNAVGNTGNVVIGTSAGAAFNGADQCVIIGNLAGDAITTGVNNTAVGYSALGANSTSLGCVAVGHNALAALTTTSNNNVAVGLSAGQSITNGSTTNLFVGHQAGGSMTSGSDNVFVGAYSGSGSMSGTVNISTGAGTRRFWHDATDAFVSHATTASAANAVLNSGTNALQRSTSSLRYKRDVEPMDLPRATALLDLQPIFYRSKIATDRQDWSYYGFSAEELAEIEPRFVQWAPHPDDWTDPDENKERFPKPDARLIPDGVAYDRMVVPLLAIIKEQQKAIDDLAARVEKLEAKG